MTREDVLRMSRAAGLNMGTIQQYERFAQLVANAEREACARAVEAEAHMFETLAAAKSLANEIRNRH